MRRTLGAEKFARLWRSSEPVSAAFASAAGTSLDAWTPDWGVRLYGQLPTGPGISRPGVVAGLVCVLLGLVVSLVVANRRRLTL